MGGDSAPAPDYTGAAQATASGNLDNLKYQTTANRPTVVTPWGTQSWSAADPTTGAQTETVNLTPQTQQALNAQLGVQENQSQLAASMQGQVANTMSTPFQAPNLQGYMSGSGTTNQTLNSNGGQQNLNFQSGANPVNQSLSSNGQNVNLNAYGAVAPAGQTNLNTPQFSNATAQAGAQSAYKASTDLLQPGWQQDTTNLDSQLRLQGLQPGTEAYNTAAQNLSRSQASQQNQLADQAVQTGNNEANQNYASQLAGYNANTAAQNQAYSQDANTFSLGNSAAGQQYSQDANTFGLNNQAVGQQFNQSLASYGANNAASTQQLANDTNTFQAQNAAQQQAYQQALGNYNTAYNSAYQNYNMPLNEMNAVLTGNQVSSPNFGSYSQAGYVNGADQTGAATALGQYNSASTAASNASTGSTIGAIAGLAGTALAFY